MAKINIVIDQDKKALKVAQIITDLDAIINASSMTNAQAIRALKKLATNQKRIIKRIV